MRIGMIGDTHFTNKAPSRRLDDFWKTQKRKIRQALDIFRDRRCQYVLQAGDLADNPSISNQVISELIHIFKNYVHWIGRPVGATWGQHDVYGHSSATLPNSPISVIESAGFITICGPEGLQIGYYTDTENVMVYGSGFGQDIPVPKTDAYNILVAHRMVGDRPIFPDQELENPVKFLNQNPAYNLILVGDYHYRFIAREGNRTIINCGALVRKSISQFDLEHEPAVAVIDTITNDLEIIKLDIEPVEKVFDMTPVQKRDESKLVKFIDDLRRQHSTESRMGVGWRQKLIDAMRTHNSSPEVRAIIDKALERIHQ